MKSGRKRKSSSPEPTHAKVAKREPRAYAESRLTFSPEKRIFTPSKRKVPNTSSPRRPSFRFKCYGQETAESELGMAQSSSRLGSSPLQSEVDAELGLVIRLDEEENKEPEELRKRGGKPIKRLASNDYRAMADSERDAEGSDLDEDSEEEFRKLDRDLAVKSKQHNLTSVHVRSIIHEVITNEHVVAMMKAAIRETQDMPMFEPKMTRSKLKEVVEKGVGMPNWNISPIKQSKELKPPQFVDIPLEDEEDSSDEEYYPDEDEEYETAEETTLESDMDSVASSPRISRQARPCTPIESSEFNEERSNSPRMKQRHLRVEAVPMGPPAPPSQSGFASRPSRALDSFMEKLHAVDEELDLNPLSIEPYPALNSGENAEESLVACRTRSKRPLRDIPLDQLEAELKAPDITPDMYDCFSALEDKEWSQWLQGLMTSRLDNEEDGDGDDDDDDPEYNFLEDLDEPDLEDYRTDRAVRITKKEVNELMEELFEMFQDEVGVNEDEEAHEEDEASKLSSQSPAKFNIPQAIRFEEPLAHMLTVCRRTVRDQLDALQQRREHQSQPQYNAPGPAMLLIPPPCTLMVTPTQKLQLQQQVQQHVQLLTQVNMLCSSVEALQSQATTTKLFLMELQSFAERAEQMRAAVEPGFKSAFRVCNFQPSLDLLEELEKTDSQPTPQPKSSKSHAVHRYPFLPHHLAWLFATRSVFLYPELLPHCSLDPALQPPRSKTIYTKGEDGLFVLGLKHFSETEFPYHLMSQYLLQPKRVEQLRVRVKDMCSSRTADNIIKFYCQHHMVPPLPVACCPVVAGSERPPVERDKSIMPNWLLKSLPYIHKAMFQRQSEETSSNIRTISPPLLTFPEGTQYPASLPKGLTLQLHPSAKRQTPVRPPKPRLLHGFARPASKPLAKAPLCPIGTVNLLSSVPAPLPSQSVILLTQTPLTPVSEVLPVNQVTTSPAHGTVPLNSVGPVNFQYIVPQQGCVNPTEPPASLPPASVQIPSTLAVACNRPIPANGVGKSINILQTKTEVPRKKFMPRKLLPIHPSPFNPIQLHHHTPVSVTLSTTPPSANFMDKSSPTAPSVVIIQPSSVLDTHFHPPADSQGLVKSSNSPPPQDSFAQNVSGIHLSGTLSRPLPSNGVKMASPDTNKKPVDSKIELKSSPRFFSHTSSSLHMTENPKSSPSVQGEVDWKPSLPTVKDELACDVLMSNYQSNPLPDAIINSIRTASLNCSSLVPRSRSIMVSHTTSTQGLSTHTNVSNNSQYMLLQAASQTGTPQSFLLPVTSLIPNQPLVDFAKGESRVPQQKIIHNSSKSFSTSSMPEQLSLLPVGLPLEGAISQALHPARTEMGDGELWKEDMEAGAEVGGEDMASAIFESPFLKLSESSCSPHSNLSNISQIDSSTGTLENMMDCSCNNLEQHSSHFSQASDDDTPNASLDTNRGVGQVHSTGEVPGLLTFTSGTENQETPGGGGGLNKKYRGEEGEGHPNEESGGEERDANDGERRGDGDGGRERQDGGRDRHDDDKDGDGDREEEEEDFDELTQDEDEEEVMSSASEESVLSVPELQETMEKLTWLASERRLCGEGDSEEDNSPNSPTSPTSPISQNSQEENSEDEEDGAIKGEELEPTEGDRGKLPEGDAPQEDDPPQISGKVAGRGRGRARPPPRSLRKSRRQERGSKDTSKLLLLCDDHILDNDPMRESKDIAYAQAYLNRVKEALQDTPGKVEDFLSLLYEFEQGSEGRSVVELFCQLKPLLKDWPDLLRDFAAFLLPEQALECGLFEAQQAFERSRRFLRQLEISFGENPTHYQKIVKALQAASVPTPAGVEDLKTQMATLLKGHTHLQGEFSAFFDELRPPPARPGQFEEAIWPEDGGNIPEGNHGLSLGIGGFEEVTLPDLEEEEETPKIPQITGKSRKRKELGTHRNYKACNWPEKHCPCHCHFSSHDVKHRRHKRKGCPRCHGIKATVDSKSLKTGDHSFPTAEPLPEKQDEREESEKGEEEKKGTETDVKDESCSGANSPHHEPEVQTWDSSEADPLANPEERDADEEEEEEWKEGDQCSSPHKSRREEEVPTTEHSDTFIQSGEREIAQQSRQSPSSETPVCAKNVSLTPSGEKVVLWTREADRVILTACQQQGASQSTFQSVSAQLGNKTANEVSKRFRDLMRLFHTSAHQASSDEEATEQQSATDEEQD